MTDRKIPNPREEDIMAGDRRLSRPDSSLPDWEMPDTAYRPVPIVWFTGAFLLHFVIASTLLVITINQADWLPVALTALSGGAVLKWTWDRGMHSAGRGWKVATVLALATNTLFVTAAALSV